MCAIGVAKFNLVDVFKGDVFRQTNGARAAQHDLVVAHAAIDSSARRKGIARRKPEFVIAVAAEHAIPTRAVIEPVVAAQPVQLIAIRTAHHRARARAARACRIRLRDVQLPRIPVLRARNPVRMDRLRNIRACVVWRKQQRGQGLIGGKIGGDKRNGHKNLREISKCKTVEKPGFRAWHRKNCHEIGRFKFGALIVQRTRHQDVR